MHRNKESRPITLRTLIATLALVLSTIVSFASAQDDIRVVRDIPYRPNAKTAYERERCKLDLYLPATGENFTTIMWIHGGALRAGHKADDIAVIVAETFAKNGVAVASPNYRLHPYVEFPKYVTDAAAAFAFVHKHIAEYGGAADRVYISGHSAGGYLTAMVGMDPRYLARHGLKLSDIAGIIPVSGQMVTHSTVRSERDVPANRLIIDAAAPAFYVSPGAPRCLCIVGGDDLPIRAEENRLFVAAMKAAEHPDVAYLEVPGRNHGTVANRIGQPDDVVAQAMFEFIKPKE